MVAACQRLVKPNGVVFFSTINRTAKSYLMMIIGAEYVLRWVPKGTHEHAKFIRPSELLNFTDRANLACTDITGVHYHPVMKHFYLANNVDVNYMIMTRPHAQ